jgi:hypothetical protein
LEEALELNGKGFEALKLVHSTSFSIVKIIKIMPKHAFQSPSLRKYILIECVVDDIFIVVQ